MSYPLSHHGYTPITVGTGDQASSVSSEAPLSGVPSTGHQPARVQKRKSSKSNSGKQLSRSVSTPQLKGLGSMSDDDKKRNKLGYQRISIACAHCRRRKIRCLLADGDPHQRCQNCIRLKRECHFYPVDQHGAGENRSQSSSKTGVGSVPSSGVSPSPPDMGASKAFERDRQFGSFPSVPSNAPPGYHSLPIEPGSALPGQGELIPAFTAHGMSESDHARAPHPDFRYEPHPEDQQPWETADTLSPQSQAALNRSDEAIHAGYWRPPQAPSADFAPFPGGPPTMEQMQPAASYTYQHPEMQAWQSQPPPNRSMSYDEMQTGAHPAYLPSNSMMFQPHSGPPGPPGPHPGPATYPPLDVHQSSMQVSMPGPHSAPGGTPLTPFTQAPPFMYQHPGTISSSPLQVRPPYQWYPDSSPYGPIEHQVPPPSDRSPYTTKPPQ